MYEGYFNYRLFLKKFIPCKISLRINIGEFIKKRYLAKKYQVFEAEIKR
jgi:hypothetical protein